MLGRGDEANLVNSLIADFEKAFSSLTFRLYWDNSDVCAFMAALHSIQILRRMRSHLLRRAPCRPRDASQMRFLILLYRGRRVGSVPE
jgi:hypothetical protein